MLNWTNSCIEDITVWTAVLVCPTSGLPSLRDELPEGNEIDPEAVDYSHIVRNALWDDRRAQLYLPTSGAQANAIFTTLVFSRENVRIRFCMF
jgi:hypothetical protein